MLDLNYSQEITDAVHGSIIYSGIEREIMGTPFFNRLHRILQSSMVYMTFPSNQVKRFEHSIGTMHLAGQFFFHVVCNSSDEMLDCFFNEVGNELIKWNKQKDNPATHYIHKNVLQNFAGEKVLQVKPPKNRLYSEFCPANLNSDYQFRYYVVFQSIRLVGMLHDVGHLPYSHVLEHALQLLYRKVQALKKKEAPHRYFLRIMEKYCEDSNAAIHEELGKLFVKKIFDSITDDLPKSENEDRYFLAAVIYFTQKILSSDEEAKSAESSIFSDLHRIVAGTVDCDRMDYCCRDQFFAGTSKEIPNYRRILSGMKLIYQEPTPPIEPIPPEDASRPKDRAKCIFVASSKSVYHIEKLLEQRWDIYAAINFHHRVHKHELLLESVIADLGLAEMAEDVKDKKEHPEPLKGVLPLRVSSIWQLVEAIDGPTPIEYVALQLDDAWLDTLLKHKYFDQYWENYLSLKTHASDINWHRLDELISSKKHYCSLIKRSDSFRKFDEQLWNLLLPDVRAKAFGLKAEELPANYSQFLSNGGCFAFNKALNTLASTNVPRSLFFERFEDKLNSQLKERPEIHVIDCLLSDCTFKPGLRRSEELYISAPNQGERPFSHFSRLYDILTSRQNLLPSFHVYYLPSFDDSHQEYAQPELEQLQIMLAEQAAELITMLVEAKAEKPPSVPVAAINPIKAGSPNILQIQPSAEPSALKHDKRPTLRLLKALLGQD